MQPGMEKQKWKITIGRESASLKKFPQAITHKAWVAGLLSSLSTCLPNIRPCAISLVFVDDEKIRVLNKTYRSLSRTTDVLSFAYGEKGQLEEGEIYMCLPQVLKQHTRFRTTPLQEVARLFYHGLLHIFGYDHIKKSERLRMRAVEQCAMKSARLEGLL